MDACLPQIRLSLSASICFILFRHCIYRDQGESQIADPVEDAVQGSLVLDGTGQQGVTVLLIGDTETLKPASQSVIEMTFDSDLVQGGVIHSAIEYFQG
jgi:hypothetical protein